MLVSDYSSPRMRRDGGNARTPALGYPHPSKKFSFSRGTFRIVGARGSGAGRSDFPWRQLELGNREIECEQVGPFSPPEELDGDIKRPAPMAPWLQSALAVRIMDGDVKQRYPARRNRILFAYGALTRSARETHHH